MGLEINRGNIGAFGLSFRTQFTKYHDTIELRSERCS
jgi:hypothetical protein